MHGQPDCLTPVCMEGWSSDAGGKLSVTAVRYQITDAWSSQEGDGTWTSWMAGRVSGG